MDHILYLLGLCDHHFPCILLTYTGSLSQFPLVYLLHLIYC